MADPPNARQYGIKVDKSNAAAIDAYVEYHRIVGDDDGGVMMSPEEYEAYKRKVIPMRIKNRIYTSYTSPSGMDCKMVGPETNCFCQHRYKQHQTDFKEIPAERPIMLPCKVSGCRCVSYHYVPLNGGQPIRCTCKHMADEHNEKAPYVCKKGGCTKCTGFTSSFTCGCGAGHKEHRMMIETGEEREARGHPVGQATPYQAMGGITGFSSLAEGYMRLDPSGRGAPDEAWLDQPITSHDNPFLRENVHSIKAHQMAKGAAGLPGLDQRVFDDAEERMSAMRRPEESEMDYFERRYQERLKREKAGPSRPEITDVRPGPRKALEGPKGVKSKTSTTGASSSKR
ncbi:protein FAM221A-like [Littorina saxatilis]|uniref:Protein FAM221A n=1 Tax=Littorina saxatilis TaxID=31220 RepID=A0AAN9B2R5_9CAEN